MCLRNRSLAEHLFARKHKYIVYKSHFKYLKFLCYFNVHKKNYKYCLSKSMFKVLKVNY